MLPLPGADTTVSNGMPSCAKMRANQRMLSTSFPGGFVVFMRRYSRVRCTASLCRLAMSMRFCCEPADITGTDIAEAQNNDRKRALDRHRDFIVSYGSCPSSLPNSVVIGCVRRSGGSKPLYALSELS